MAYRTASGPRREQLGVALHALADGGEIGRPAVADGEHEVRPDEDVDLAELDLLDVVEVASRRAAPRTGCRRSARAWAAGGRRSRPRRRARGGRTPRRPASSCASAGRNRPIQAIVPRLRRAGAGRPRRPSSGVSIRRPSRRCAASTMLCSTGAATSSGRASIETSAVPRRGAAFDSARSGGCGSRNRRSGRSRGSCHGPTARRSGASRARSRRSTPTARMCARARRYTRLPGNEVLARGEDRAVAQLARAAGASRGSSMDGSPRKTRSAVTGRLEVAGPGDVAVRVAEEPAVAVAGSRPRSTRPYRARSAGRRRGARRRCPSPNEAPPRPNQRVEQSDQPVLTAAGAPPEAGGPRRGKLHPGKIRRDDIPRRPRPGDARPAQELRLAPRARRPRPVRPERRRVRLPRPERRRQDDDDAAAHRPAPPRRRLDRAARPAVPTRRPAAAVRGRRARRIAVVLPVPLGPREPARAGGHGRDRSPTGRIEELLELVGLRDRARRQGRPATRSG